ncbi:MAG: phosphotransferase system enzyme I (PtsI), partial [Candidatus Paceibacteria bacterium]
MTEKPIPTDSPDPLVPEALESFELRGTSITPGMALGPVHRKDHDLSRANQRRVPLEGIERELNRFHSSLGSSKAQLKQLKDKLAGRVAAEHILILDTHIAYLGDSVFLSDVENLILNEQMSLEAAIAKVISDFDRIFRLVENELLRERAIDLRDVGIRVLRNLEPEGEGEEEQPAAPKNYILVARELSIVDMFQLDGTEIRGIATEEGGLSSHAATLARSMGLPTITGLEGLRDQVQEGDFVILDAGEGVLRVHPDEVVCAQYDQVYEHSIGSPTGDESPRGEEPFLTGDGTPIEISPTCGNLPEVEQASRVGLSGVGLYRTELLYLIDREQPSLDSLVAHYSAVLMGAGDGPVTFRLLDLNSTYGVKYLTGGSEPNPALGRSGIRLLLEHSSVLRRQLEAILRVAVEGTHVRIAVPFVTDASEMRAVKEALFEVRGGLQRAGHRLSEDIRVGAIIETPAAALGFQNLAPELEFAIVSYDGLVQYLLVSDRENHALAPTFEHLHPVVLRVIADVVKLAQKAKCPLQLFGASALQPSVLPFLLAAGVRQLCVPPILLDDLDLMLGAIEMERAVAALPKVAGATSPLDTLPVVDAFVRAYDEATAVTIPAARQESFCWAR